MQVSLAWKRIFVTKLSYHLFLLPPYKHARLPRVFSGSFFTPSSHGKSTLARFNGGRHEGELFQKRKRYSLPVVMRKKNEERKSAGEKTNRTMNFPDPFVEVNGNICRSVFSSRKTFLVSYTPYTYRSSLFLSLYYFFRDLIFSCVSCVCSLLLSIYLCRLFRLFHILFFL